MAADDGLSGTPGALVEVDFAFTCPGDDLWSVVAMHLAEALSEVPECALTIACESVDADPERLLGERVVLSWGRAEGAERHFAGLVVSVDDRGVTSDHRVAEVCIAPRLWRAGLRENYRVFQGLDAVAVAVRMLTDTGVYSDDEVDRSLVSARTPRAYCVQYGETDLAFVRRLLEEEGVGFTFEHGAGGERVVLFDGEQLGQLRTDTDPLALMGDGGATATEETLRALGALSRLTTTRVSLGDWDPRAARRTVNDPARSEAADARFEYPGRHIDGTFVEGAGVARTEAGVAQRRTDEQAGRRRALAGEGNVTRFAPGFRFTRDGPGASPEVMVVTRVVHSGTAPEVLYGARDDANHDRYANRFDCVTAATSWRPARVTPRPRALAPQSAVVTAPAGSQEEIYTDDLGRVRVRFHWQRDEVTPQWNGPDGLECTSCWMRVQQPWAASGWGAVFIPRVGMEVVVHFLDGDPDRPLVAGCVYNGATPLPVDLPAKRTQSVLRTQSSPTNGGYNELRFEDLADHEEVYLRAQRDQRIEVLHDRALSVGRDASAQIGRDESLHVGRNRSLDVEGDEQHAVDGSRQISVGGDELREVTGGHSLIVHKTFTMHADETGRMSTNDGLVIEVGGGSGATTEMSPDEIAVRAPKKHTLAVGDDVAQELTTERFAVKAPKGLALVCGDTKIEIAEDRILLQTKSGAKVELDGDKITIKAGGPVNIKGSQVTSNG